MCVSPIYVKNINRDKRFLSDDFQKYHDCESDYIPVPCGHCHECLQMKQADIIQRCQMMYHDFHMFFGTLTYSDDALPIVVDASGVYHEYADYRDFYLMIKRLRRYYPQFKRDNKYLCVTEYGSKRHRPHFHFILFLKKFDTDDEIVINNLEKQLFEAIKSEWRRNIGTSFNPQWIKLFQYKSMRQNRNYDFHYCRQKIGSLDDVSFYVSKYCLKYDKWFDHKLKVLYNTLDYDEYKRIRTIIAPKLRFSKGFGLTETSNAYITNCIERGLNTSDMPFPLFYNRLSGQSQPLGRYYKKKYLTYEQFKRFVDEKNSMKVSDYSKVLDIQKDSSDNEKFLKKKSNLSKKNLDI